jgi:hypothetical protein
MHDYVVECRYGKWNKIKKCDRNRSCIVPSFLSSRMSYTDLCGIGIMKPEPHCQGYDEVLRFVNVTNLDAVNVTAKAVEWAA